uniref:Mitochondrial fission process protein 1 n=1 Tax=Cacopsylla melanoneura TaxID=428564 RepID=A0A8D8ZTS7_9HEMI
MKLERHSEQWFTDMLSMHPMAWHSSEHNLSRVSKIAVDALLWQSLASVAIPGLVINRICHLTRNHIFTKWRHARLGTVLVGLVSIPCVIHPIDWGVTQAM